MKATRIVAATVTWILGASLGPIGCGPKTSDGAVSPAAGPTDAPAEPPEPADTPTKATEEPGQAPPFTLVPLSPEDVPCSSDEQCGPEHWCKSPEENQWNACGAPRPPHCADGWIGDSCGHCFQSCEEDDDCPGGACNGAQCISPRRCHEIVKHQ